MTTVNIVSMLKGLREAGFVEDYNHLQVRVQGYTHTGLATLYPFLQECKCFVCLFSNYRALEVHAPVNVQRMASEKTLGYKLIFKSLGTGICIILIIGSCK